MGEGACPMMGEMGGQSAGMMGHDGMSESKDKE